MIDKGRGIERKESAGLEVPGVRVAGTGWQDFALGHVGVIGNDEVGADGPLATLAR